MNIKRAFLAAAAVLMVPGYAMAQSTLNFETTVVTTNGADVTVNAALECNTGNPLTQDQDISPGLGNGVDFIVQEVTLDTDITCGITFSNLPAGFVAAALDTNGEAYPVDQPPHCRWYVVPPPDTSFPVAISNYCELTLAPAPIQYTMNKVWELDSNVDVSEQFSMNWSCYNVMTSTTATIPSTYSSSWGAIGDASNTVGGNLYPNPAGGSYCTANESNYDSAVESDQGCSGATTFAIGDGEKSCTVTNTVFFEGIPTLSQYGLAILAVLMLGVGFVGFRRFV